MLFSPVVALMLLEPNAGAWGQQACVSRGSHAIGDHGAVAMFARGVAIPLAISAI
jgi:hypothetical protein